MSSQLRERTIVRKILSWLNTQPGCWAYKTHGGPYQQAGLPDVVGVYQGHFLGLEVKRPGEVATTLQLHTLEKIRAAGGIGEVVTSLDDVGQAIGKYARRAVLVEQEPDGSRRWFCLLCGVLYVAPVYRECPRCQAHAVAAFDAIVDHAVGPEENCADDAAVEEPASARKVMG